LAGDKHSQTEKPTAKHKKEQQKKGSLARSPELLSWASVLVSSFLLQTEVRNGWNVWQSLMVRLGAAIATPDVATDMSLLSVGLDDVTKVLGPFIGALMVLGLVGNFAQVGFKPSFHGLTPSLSKLSPKGGLKKIFSAKGGWESIKSLLKIVILGLLGWRYLESIITKMTSQGQLSVVDMAGATAKLSLGFVRTVGAIGLVLAAFDYIIQRRSTNKGMMMTKHAVKEEHKSNEGSPRMKGEVRRRGRRMSRMRMIASVATADAVVLNPTHVAVAVKYEPGRGAPRVVAKGADLLAARIRKEAEAHRIPMVEDVALARALYFACELEDEIPLELYEAVARLLAFLFALKNRGAATRVDGAAHRPSQPFLTGALAEQALEEDGGAR
jgi:flagellar biosynthetic protein FlhB